MERATQSSLADVSERERRLLDRLSKKYEKSQNAGQIRSYVIASGAIAVMFALSRWIPWWGVALFVVEVAGLALFRQYKRFAAFKSSLLGRLWRHVKNGAAS